MRDIIHPYIGLGGVPLRDAGAVLKDGRETAEMEQIRAEILRLGAVQGPEPDWRAVVDCSVVILRDQRKDLQVACYLAWGLFEREGYTGLAVGLTIVKDMIALYWDALHPPLDRPKARLGCLDWLAENLSARMERRLPAAGDGPALDRTLAVLVDLEEDLRRRFGHKAPPFGHVRRQAAEYLGRLPGPKPAPAAVPSAEAQRPTLPPVAPPPEDPPPPPAAPVVEVMPPPRPQKSDPAPRPSRPRNVGPILTPAERARRRARIIAAAAVALLLLGLAGGGGAYWMVEVKRIEDVVALLRAPDAAERAAGLAALAALPERQRASILHDHAEAILDHHLGAMQAAADRYALLEADAHLEAARALYPDSARLAAESLRLERRKADLAVDIRSRRDEARQQVEARMRAILPRTEADEAQGTLQRMLRHIEAGDLRNARIALDRLAALLPASDQAIGTLMPHLTALAFLDLAEHQADREHFTRSLQVIADGLTFLPDHPMLVTARQRYLTGRSEYLIRNTVAVPASLDTLLVREAVNHLRTEAPHRFRTLSEGLSAPLADALRRLESTDPAKAQALTATAASLLAAE